MCRVGSTQSNESFNRIVASKHPKTHFYAASESTAFRSRVAAAVAQKNIGHSTIAKAHEQLLLSPGKNTEDHIQSMDRKRENDNDRKSSTEYEKRRHELRTSTATHVSTIEVKEGATYQSGVDIYNSTIQDLTAIPEHIIPPVPSNIPPGKYSYVYFDLETTGLGTSSEIVQLAAVCGNQSFDRHVMLPCNWSTYCRYQIVSP